jgi:hypothetical protein
MFRKSPNTTAILGGLSITLGGADPPCRMVIEPWPEDPFPDYDTEPIQAYGNK